MASIILRQSNVISSPGATIKGSPLSNSEVDNNFANLNVQVSDLSNTVSTLVTSEISNGTSNVTITTANGPVRVSTNFQPLVGNIYDLGSATSRFDDTFLSGNIDIKGTRISVDAGGNILIGGNIAISSTGAFIGVMSGDIDVSSAIGAGEITSDKIANAAVTAAKIATGAVGSTQLASTGVAAATYGSSTSVPVIVVDEDGRITSASNQGIVIGSSQLSSTGVTAATYGGTTAVPVLVVDEDGRITTAANATISAGGTTVTIVDNTTSSATFYPTMTTDTTGNVSNVTVSSTKLYFVPETGTFNATEFNSLSDISVKENIITITSPLSVIEKLSGVEFNWIDSKKKSSGVVAQDVEKVLSHLVSKSESGMKSVNYDGIIAYLIESIKELSEKVKKLENK